ncbi:MAG TPA: hypothetical protein VJ851_03640 [Jatrophihabitans sp.]|nr:hypothetical protein [Jatrophihabitans sp.]
MSGGFVAGFAAALVAAVCYGVAPVVQAQVAQNSPLGRGPGIGLLLRLARRPLWLVAVAGEFGGFLAEAYAFSQAPTTLVAPVAACDMLVFVVTGCLVFRYRPSATGVLGALATIAGVLSLAVADRGDLLGRPASTGTMIVFVVCAVVAAGLAVLAGWRAGGRTVPAAIAFSAGAGVAYGIATLATRQIGRTFHLDAVGRLLASPTPYVLVACSLLAMGLLQRGLQTAPLITFPIVSALSALLPVVVGLLFLDDPAPPGWRRALLVVALALIVAGLGLMARDRLAAERGTARAQSGTG